MMTCPEELRSLGFSLRSGVLASDEVRRLVEWLDRALPPGAPGLRRVFDRLPGLAAAVERTGAASLVEELLGTSTQVVRTILFDKSADANWSVPWHQDAVIAVAASADVPGFGPWSIKDGVHHCRPPREILDRILVVRLHLDDCGSENGPLRVIPGSHRDGILEGEAVEAMVARSAFVECCVAAGGAVVMRPHLIHSSPRARAPSRRRVLHLEFCDAPLPGGLEWAERYEWRGSSAGRFWGKNPAEV